LITRAAWVLIGGGMMLGSCTLVSWIIEGCLGLRWRDGRARGKRTERALIGGAADIALFFATCPSMRELANRLPVSNGYIC
ncbi:hypothetical protein BJX63DRAFT_411435, partial [Aspergillus granulosus]